MSWRFRKDGSSVLIKENGFSICYGNSGNEEGTKKYKDRSVALREVRKMEYYPENDIRVRHLFKIPNFMKI